MYHTLATHPNISYVVNWLAQFTSNPKAMHWTAVKWVFQYIKQTKNANLTYGSTSTIFTDNQAAIAISHHPEFHTHTKHINICYHFLCDLISAGTVNTIYVNTHNNLANLFTKGLSWSTHQDLTYQIGVIIPEY